MACRGSGVRVPPAPPPTSVKSGGTAIGPPFVLTSGGFVMSSQPTEWTDEDGVASMTITRAQPRTASDGRRWTLRPARPTDARALARLFDDVRPRGSLAGDAAQRGEPAVGGVLHRRDAAHRGRPGAGGRGGRRLDRQRADQRGAQRGEQPRRHAQSICVADGWREVGIGSALVRGRHRNGRASGAWPRSRWPSSPTTSAPSPCTSTPASSARGCAASSTAPAASAARRAADGLVPRLGGGRRG